MTARPRNPRPNRIFAWTLVATLILLAGFVLLQTHGKTVAATSPAATQQRALAAYSNLPLAFEPNQGQTDPQVKYMARGNGYTLFLTNQEAVISLLAPSKRAVRGVPQKVAQVTPAPDSVVRMQIVGANAQAHVTGSDVQQGVSNYFIGDDPHKWSTNVPHFAQVTYEGVYPGINLAFAGNHQALDFHFAVSANANPALIHLHFNGADKASLNQDGSLTLSATSHQLQIAKPVAYQNVNGERKEVAANFVVANDSTVSFALGSYDRAQELQIEPSLATSPATGQPCPSRTRTRIQRLLSLTFCGCR